MKSHDSYQPLSSENNPTYRVSNDYELLWKLLEEGHKIIYYYPEDRLVSSYVMTREGWESKEQFSDFLLLHRFAFILPHQAVEDEVILKAIQFGAELESGLVQRDFEKYPNTNGAYSGRIAQFRAEVLGENQIVKP